MNEKINHPNHYNQGGIEVIDFMKQYMSEEELTGFAIGNVIKYVARYRHKNGIEDLKKAKWYLDYAINEMNVVEKK